jgi:hypothetical protein
VVESVAVTAVESTTAAVSTAVESEEVSVVELLEQAAKTNIEANNNVTDFIKFDLIMYLIN